MKTLFLAQALGHGSNQRRNSTQVVEDPAPSNQRSTELDKANYKAFVAERRHGSTQRHDHVLVDWLNNSAKAPSQK